MNLDLVRAVLEIIFLRNNLSRELALLADGNKTFPERVRQGRADNEAARFDAHDSIEFKIQMHIPLGQGIDDEPETHRVLDQRGDVAEHDPFLGIIGDGPDL